jgi:hypothetical protein
VIFFLPWLLLGIAYLLEWLRHRRARAAPVIHRKVMTVLPAAWRRNPATAPGDALADGVGKQWVRDRLGTGCARSGESDDAEPRK